MIEKLVKQLARELDMEEIITSTGNRQFTLPFIDDIQVEVIETEQSLFFKGTIGPCPKVKPEPLIQRIMEANLFGIGTRNASIGLIQDENVLTLSQELDYNSSYKDFKDKLEDFVTVIDFWRKEIVGIK